MGAVVKYDVNHIMQPCASWLAVSGPSVRKRMRVRVVLVVHQWLPSLGRILG